MSRRHHIHTVQVLVGGCALCAVSVYGVRCGVRVAPSAMGYSLETRTNLVGPQATRLGSFTAIGELI